MVYTHEAIILLAVAAFALGLMTSRAYLAELCAFIAEKLIEAWEAVRAMWRVLFAVWEWLKITCGMLSFIFSLMLNLFRERVRGIWERIKLFLKMLLAILLGVLTAIWWAALLVLSSEEASREVNNTDNTDWLTIGFLLLVVITLVALGLVMIRWIRAILAGILLITLIFVASVSGGIIGVVLGLMLLAFILGLTSLLADGIARIPLLLGAIGAILIALLRGCVSELPKAPPTPATATRQAEAVGVIETVLPLEDWEVRAIIWARAGDGCIRITQRGGYPLTLPECIVLTREYGRDPLWYNGLIIAPLVGRREVWYLMENRATSELCWIPARHTVN